ncbi:hypothetical protein N7475_000335 [Penicillium sp. IBT 31633x]|nr:hypothetical protein N7475_000335 [Penicillium sp. IBT 31633x]
MVADGVYISVESVDANELHLRAPFEILKWSPNLRGHNATSSDREQIFDFCSTYGKLRVAASILRVYPIRPSRQRHPVTKSSLAPPSI